MLTHARFCEVLAWVALRKRRRFSALFPSLLEGLGFFLDGGKGFLQPPPGS